MKTNKASLGKRILAYLIDIILVFIIVILLEALLPKNNNIEILNRELNETTDQFFGKQIDFSVYFNQTALIFRDLDKARIMYSVINAVLIFIYFIFIPYFFDGKTIGKKILKIKTIRNDQEYLSLKNLVIKNMIDTGLMYMLFSLMLIYILPGTSYFTFTLFLSIFQIGLIITSFIMIIKRKDKRGLNDILSGTKVIEDNIIEDNVEVEEWENLVNKN